MASVSSVGDGLTRQFVQAAQDALGTGEARKGRWLARQALVRSVAAGDRGLEAEAALVLSHAYVLASRMRLAHRMSSRAQRLFTRNSNAAGQAEALAVHSYSACVLGLDSQALQAACDSIALRTDHSSPLAQARGLNYLGLASTWTGDGATARGALEASIWFAGQANDPATGFQPLVNLCFAEVLRTVEDDRRCHGSADFAELEALVARARAMAESGRSGGFYQPAREIGFLLLDFAGCFVASRRGRTGEADACYLACLERAARFPRTNWVQSVVWWARLERALCYGDIDTSIESLHAMGEAARAGEHAQFQALARTLAGTLRPPLNQGDSVQ